MIHLVIHLHREKTYKTYSASEGDAVPAAAAAPTTTAAGSFVLGSLEVYFPTFLLYLHKCFLLSKLAFLHLFFNPFTAAVLPRVSDWSAEVEEEEERIQHEQQNRSNRERGIIRLPQPAAESLRWGETEKVLQSSLSLCPIGALKL